MAWALCAIKIGVGVQCDAYCDGDINVNLSQDVKYTESVFLLR
jgi:hypothetical protein